jgi:hypothetical protein
VPDHPGVLAGITQALGAERINIEDFELRHFSPERGGVLTMLVTGAEQAERAAALLEAQGYGVVGRARPPRMNVSPASSFRAGVSVPGDKSISHRAVLLGAIADGETVIEGFGRSADTESTIARVRRSASRWGRATTRAGRGRGPARAARRRADRLRQRGHARAAARRAARGQDGRFELTGDESLRSRPMERIAEPLRQMGATSRRPTAGCRCGSRRGRCTPIAYELPVASAQVKSCVLLPACSPATGRRRSSSRRRRATTRSGCFERPARGSRRARGGSRSGPPSGWSRCG